MYLYRSCKKRWKHTQNIKILLLVLVDETVQPQNTNFGVQVFPDVHDKQTQAAIVPEVTHCSKNK